MRGNASLCQQEQRDAERQQRPDHQAEARRDEEVAARCRRCDERGHGYERKNAIRPKMKA